jgi:hypothetical protein
LDEHILLVRLFPLNCFYGKEESKSILVNGE